MARGATGAPIPCAAPAGVRRVPRPWGAHVGVEPGSFGAPPQPTGRPIGACDEDRRIARASRRPLGGRRRSRDLPDRRYDLAPRIPLAVAKVEGPRLEGS